MVIKTRYFNLMKVYDATGKYLGSVQDIAIDFYNGMVTGFIINSFSLNKKKNYKTYLDKSCKVLKYIIVSAGKIGYQIKISPNDLLNVVSGEVEELTK